MGYKIRYEPARWREKPGWYTIRFQIAATAVLLTLVLAFRYWQPGYDAMARWLLPGELDGTELAFQAMAQTVAAGEGWYQGAVAFGRCLLQMAGN